MTRNNKPHRIIATSVATGEELRFPSVCHAVTDGGFDMDSIYKCIQGKSHSGIHAGFRFRVDGPYSYTPSPRLLEVAELMKEGLNKHGIAARLGLTSGTARGYMSQCRGLSLAK